MFCKFCGANIDDNSRFCAYCGSYLNDETNTPQNISLKNNISSQKSSISFCKSCGSRLDDTYLFCPYCNSLLENPTLGIRVYTIVIYREPQSYIVPAMKISIDGKICGNIESGGSLEFGLSGGHHRFDISCSFRKRSLELDIDRNVNITLSLSPFIGSIVAKTNL